MQYFLTSSHHQITTRLNKRYKAKLDAKTFHSIDTFLDLLNDEKYKTSLQWVRASDILNKAMFLPNKYIYSKLYFSDDKYGRNICGWSVIDSDEVSDNKCSIPYYICSYKALRYIIRTYDTWYLTDISHILLEEFIIHEVTKNGDTNIIPWVIVSDSYHFGPSANMLIKCQKYVKWDILLKTKYKLTDNILEGCKDYIDWNYMSQKKELSDEFIAKFQDKLNWKIILKKKVSNELLERCKENVDWDYVSKEYPLEDAFITQFKDKLNWFILSHRKLTSPMLDKYATYINWKIISRLRDMSPMFIEKYRKYLDLDILLQRAVLTTDEYDYWKTH